MNATKYKKGDQITIKPEWSDGDDRFTTRVIENNGDRLLVVHECGFTINPTEVIALDMVQGLAK